MKPPILLFSVALLASGCTVGPNYKRPTVAVPGLYRGTVSTEAAPTQLAALGDQKWWDIFQDEQLRTLIRTAVVQNYDSRIAASRVLEARAQLGITRADQFPSVGAGAGISDTRNSQSRFLPAFETSTGQVNLAAAWELDFWGKYRRATEAARANLIASEWARREVLSTLVATTLLDVRQAEQLVFTASAEVPVLEQQIEQQENFLSILLGQNPEDIPRGQTLTEQRQPPEVPAGLPSALLERRPDIQQAEAQLVAANAEIGVARSAYFPQISLNGAGGFQSSALTSLFTGPAGAWSFGASLTQPIFTGGRLRSQVRLAEARQQTAVLFYQQSIQGAFRDVSDGLVAYRKTREFRTQQELLFRSAEDAARLSHMRYNGGVTGYLEVLTNETNAFSTELGLVQAQLNELLAVVQLYQALGGGWQQ